MFQLFYSGKQHGPYVLDQIKSMWASEYPLMLVLSNILRMILEEL